MLKHFFTLLLLAFCTNTLIAASEVLPYKTNVEIDGMNKEWGPRLPKYDKGTDINYSVANDEKNLYFILRISDESIQKQIAKNGLEIWINPNGKKRKVTGLTSLLITPFPANELILTGFLLENGKQPLKGCPVRISISKDPSNCFIYELCVPFNTFYKEQLDVSDSEIIFYFGFVVKSPQKIEVDTDMPMMEGPEGMGGSGRMGGPGGMGRPGGMDMSSQKTASPTNSDKTVWFKALLNIK